MRNPISGIAFVAASCVIVAALAGGCGGQPEDRAYLHDLSSNDLVGCWVITTPSLAALQKAGYSRYTNQADHCVLLNADGTCVYRASDYYAAPMFRMMTGLTEEREIVRFADEGRFSRKDWPDGIAGCHSWYVFRPSEGQVLLGPFTNTIGLQTYGGEILKNRHDRWRLVDGKAAGQMFHDDSGNTYRYQVRFSNHHFDQYVTFLHVRRHNSEFELWTPLTLRPSGLSDLDAGTICVRFRRLQPEHK
jgi:hypothetical protein